MTTWTDDDLERLKFRRTHDLRWARRDGTTVMVVGDFGAVTISQRTTTTADTIHLVIDDLERLRALVHGVFGDHQ